MKKKDISTFSLNQRRNNCLKSCKEMFIGLVCTPDSAGSAFFFKCWVSSLVHVAFLDLTASCRANEVVER